MMAFQRGIPSVAAKASPLKMPVWLVAGMMVLILAAAAMRSAHADFPAAVDGRPLPSLAPMLEKVTPAVVNIATQGHVEIRMNPLLNDPFFRRFFNVPDQPMERKTQALGSGVIIDAKRGLVVTNNHVIANADQISVKLHDGRVLDAKLVGTDPDTDVAVIKIPPEHLSALPMADSDKLRVGDFVVAIGNPFGLGQTVTSGIVSALARSGLGLGEYEDYIQTDASINPGNSGGALVNLRGELVGINTAIFSRSGGNIGIGFAIPVNNVRRVTEQLVQFGEVKHGFLGGMFQDLTPDLAQAFGVPRSEGAVAVAVSPGSPAEKAGLRPGDVIVKLNGKQVMGAGELRNQIGLMRAGDKVALEVLRSGKPKQLAATIAARSEDGSNGPVKNPRLAGATIGDIPKDSPVYGSVQGVLVTDVERGSRAWRNGLRPGDIVFSVNRVPFNGLDAFLRLVNGNDRQLVLGVRRGNAAAFMVVK